nr:alpha/beta hydrolase [Pseudovibrio flavus]
MDYASTTVSIPASHQPGAIEWPKTLPGDPNTDFVVRDAHYINGNDAFRATYKKQLNALPKANRSTMVFIHGYNTLFAEAVFRYAQFANDSGFKGVPVLFTWASRGSVANYVYDNNSATVARDGLDQLLTNIGKDTDGPIMIIAHSMGNWALLETLRQMQLSGNSITKRKNVYIILAAPDVDVDVFKNQMRSIGKLANPPLILLSKDDRALKLSNLIAGDEGRLGSYADDSELADLGVIVLDLTNVETNDSSRHNKFAEIAVDLPKLREVLEAHNINVSKSNRGFSQSVGNAGRSLGTFIKSAADVVVTVPRSLIVAD